MVIRYHMGLEEETMKPHKEEHQMLMFSALLCLLNWFISILLKLNAVDLQRQKQ